MTIAIIVFFVTIIVALISEFVYMLLSGILSLLGTISGSALFGIPAVNSLLTLISIWSGTIIVIAITFKIFKLMLEISEGKNISVGANIRSIFVSLVLAVWGFDLARGVFYLGELMRTEMANKFSYDITLLSATISTATKGLWSTVFVAGFVSGNASLVGVALSELLKVFGDLFAIIIVVVFIYQAFKLLVETFERTMQFFYSMVQMPLFVTMYIGGNDQALGTWFKQMFVIMLGLALRFVGINLAFLILMQSTSVFGNFDIFAVVGVLMATGKADQSLQAFGGSQGWGGSGRMVKSTITDGAHLSSFFRKGG